MKKTINLDVKIKEIIDYLDTSHRNKVIDIICLQGFLDRISLDSFIKEYKNYCLKNKNSMYFAPSFDNIDPTIDSSDNIEIESLSYTRFNENKTPISNKFSINENNNKKKLNHNIIISKYPIISTIFSELDDQTDMDDILGIQTVI